MAALALRDDRWRVHHLGIGVPAEDLRALAHDVKADVIVLSATYANQVEAQSYAAILRADGFKVLLGGTDGKTLTDLVSGARALAKS